jgi:hypothetical protein
MTSTDQVKPTISGLFTDVFRRADKSDDGRIDVAEFNSFFADDRTTDEDMRAHFATCDEDHSGNIDHAELTKFFGGGIGKSYVDLFKTLETLHLQFGDALRSSYDAHTTAKSATELFKERFLLREFVHQLQNLDHNAESALRGVSALSPIVRAPTTHSPEHAPHPVATPAHGTDVAHSLTVQVDKLVCVVVGRRALFSTVRTLHRLH